MARCAAVLGFYVGSEDLMSGDFTFWAIFTSLCMNFLCFEEQCIHPHLYLHLTFSHVHVPEIGCFSFFLGTSFREEEGQLHFLSSILFLSLLAVRSVALEILLAGLGWRKKLSSPPLGIADKAPWSDGDGLHPCSSLQHTHLGVPPHPPNLLHCGPNVPVWGWLSHQLSKDTLL